MTETLLLYGSILLCLVFAFTNGMKDGCNVFATAVASGSLGFRKARWIVTAAELIGPFLFGIPVAQTVARGIISVDLLPRGSEALILILCGIGGALLWNIITWMLRLPTSSSFTLVGGLIGPVLLRYGKAGIPWESFLVKVLGALFLSPILGLIFGHLLHRFLSWLLQDAPWRTNRSLKKLQILSLIGLGLNHGTNDSQKAMGLIALLLYLSGRAARIEVPLWVMAASILSLTVGIFLGGTKILKTVGYGIFRLRPLHSFGSQMAATGILLACNLAGAPVSTTQIISSTVMGVGNASRQKQVRWRLIQTIFVSWLMTIPLAGAVSAGLYFLVAYLLEVMR